ncbi:MAG: nucleotidyltransferase family protein [Bdellovibrionales bacterium]|nr:nucleotidyltransferase family protein [Bdellovibrionales bacterium]
MELRQTLKLVHELFKKNGINHALIGGLGLACYGSTRATVDLDLLIYESSKESAKKLLLDNKFELVFESQEVLQFTGVGYVDLLIARRPLSKEILKLANSNGPEGINYVRAEDLIGLKIQAYKNDKTREFQDKADIQYLIESQKNLDWNLIKKYADLFGEWEVINEIKKTAQS